MSSLKEENDPVLKVVLKGHRKPVTDISCHPDTRSKKFATASEDGTLMIWDNADNPCHNYMGHTNSITGLEYTSDGRILGSCSIDQTVRFWNPRINGDCSEIKAHLSPIHCMSFSDDSSKLVTGARDKAIKMWDVPTKHFISSFLGHNHWVESVKFFPNGKIIASAANDKNLKLWDVLSGKCVHSFVSTDGHPVCVAPYPNNNSVAVAMSSGAVRIYEMRTRKLQQHYVLHTDTTYVSWHPFDNYLVSCGKDGKVRIVDVIEGRPIYTLGGHDGDVTCVKFSADGKNLVTGGTDNLVMVWNTNFLDC